MEGSQYIKLIIIGDSQVGKSSILTRFVDGEFDENISCTIGVDYKSKILNIDDKSWNITIWDTAGQERFRSLSSCYYRGSHGIILVYDVTNQKSFDNLEIWINETMLHSTDENVIKLLVGNKIDKDNRQITTNMGIEFAKKHEMLFIETSAKTIIGIEQTFMEIINKIIDRYNFEKENSLSFNDIDNKYGCICFI